MKKVVVLLILPYLVSCSHERSKPVEGGEVEPQQDVNYVGDKVEGTAVQGNYIKINPVSPPYVEIREKSFTLKLSRDELVKSIDSLGAKTGGAKDEVWRKVLKVSSDLLKSEDELVFYDIWRAGEFESTSWEEALEMGDRWATAMLVRELACGLIDKGKVQLTEGGSEQEGYYVVSGIHYPYSKGIVTKSDLIIWLCPPYIAI